VYEDNTNNKEEESVDRSANDENDHDRSERSSNLSDGAIRFVHKKVYIQDRVSKCFITFSRDPLTELKQNDFLETPMSVAEMLSPMSVDKTALVEEQIERPLPRTDRDRFFEVEDYQEDILTYMKEAEVGCVCFFCLFKNCCLLVKFIRGIVYILIVSRVRRKSLNA
jgi:hypothetical protein